MPRQPGGYWIYDNIFQSEEGSRKAEGFSREDVVATKEVEGKSCFLVKLTIDWRSDRLRAIGVPLGEDDVDYFWEYNDEKGSHNYSPEGDPFTPPETLDAFQLTLPYPVEVGHSMDHLNEKWSVVAVDKKVSVPAGDFDCVVYESVYHMAPGEEPVSKTTFYMKPGVGAVRIELYEKADTGWNMYMQNNLREYAIGRERAEPEVDKPDKAETQAEPNTDLNAYLSTGSFEAGIAHFKSRLASEEILPSDRFSLAALQVLRAIEGLAQDLTRFGLGNKSGFLRQLPFIRMPVPENPEPEVATYAGIQSMLARFQRGIGEANTTLTGLTATPFRVPIDINAVRIDYNGDGELGDSDYFHLIYARYFGGQPGAASADQPFVIQFDTGDGFWLKGYSHLLMALTDLQLGHDWEELYDLFAGYVFPGAGDAFPHLKRSLRPTGGSASLVEGSAFMHLMRFPVIDPKRVSTAHEHLLEVIECSRASMALYAAETDNEREWIPNSEQDSVTGAEMTEDRNFAWNAFLNEMESMLEGELLVPHWRIEEGYGINLKRVFLEPSTLDVVLWAHGVGMLPYVEAGKTSEADTWRYVMDGFDGMFPAFAVWIN